MLLTEINTGKVFSWSAVISQVTEVTYRVRAKTKLFFLGHVSIYVISLFLFIFSH